ncbi:MAG: SAM-dependent methyltransferase [Clostridia bacterium]|nr:SAM-dependent methyltransferase [Clostridia bacterium]
MNNNSTSNPVNTEKLASLILLAAEKQSLKKAVFSKPADKTIVRMVMTVRNISSKNLLQAEYFHTDNKAKHKNISFEDAEIELSKIISGFSQINLICTAGSCEYKLSKSGSSVIIGESKLRRALLADGIDKVSIQKNNIEKKHVLDGSEPFLKLLGISDENGRIYDKKQLKFRQINRFVEMIRDIEGELPKGEISICDLCCGKSYLSFAVYHYFANVLNYKVTMVGVDLKSDVIEYCSEVAEKLGFDGLRFVCGNVLDFQAEVLPDLVVSLHACDTATDIVLDKAIEWNTKVILATPCCHHELNHTLNCGKLSFIAEHSMLKQKFCDAATDALRLKRLQSRGYRTAALELVESAPKNIMLRAVKTSSADSPSAKRAKEEYELAKAFLLGADIPTSRGNE